jgi:HAD superfamily hydrolase (TIGR01509 family)
MTAKPIRALLFDLDGTIADTGELHYRATIETLEEFGAKVDRATYDRIIHGATNADIVDYFFPDSGRARDHYADAKERRFRASVNGLKPLPGLTDLLHWAAQRKIATAVVTNAPAANTDRILGALGLAERFDAIILGDDLPRGKPDPLPYLMAVETLGVDSTEAVGFEDSAPGVRSVAGAGVFAVGILSGLSEATLVGEGARMVIADFRDGRLMEYLRGRDPFSPNRP